jgi:integrase
MAHIRKRTLKSGKTAYIARWLEHGIERQKSFATERAAERHALRVEDQLRRKGDSDGLYVRRETVADVVDSVMASPDWGELKPSTVDGYRKLYESDILPKWGKRKVASITGQEIEAWYAELLKSGLSKATVRHRHIALGKMFKYAAKHRLVSYNPMEAVTAPVPEKGRGVALRPEQVEAIAVQLDGHHPYGLLVRFAAATGLRAGEMVGLRVRDVNLLKREIRVEQTIIRVSGETVVGAPKSKNSTRTVPILGSALIRDLTAYLEQHPNRANPDALLWPGRKVGGTHELDYSKPFSHGSFYQWHFRPALAKAGLIGQVLPTGDGTFLAVCTGTDHQAEYHTEDEAARHIARHVKGGPRFHDLRHTAGSSWLAMGTDLLKVSRRLGHSTIAITADIYGHVMEEDYAEESARYDAWVAQASAR